MLNAAQFSAAKSEAEAKLMQAEVFDKGDRIRSYAEFAEKAKAITDVTQETWLRVEYESCRRNAIQADRWLAMAADKDLYPYWIYRGMMDDREREEHVELEGQVFKIGDPYGDEIYPPSSWNCRCSGEPADEDDLKDENKQFSINTPAESQGLLEKFVDEDFRYNSAAQGMMPNNSSYSDVMGSANDVDYKTFGLPEDPEQAENE